LLRFGYYDLEYAISEDRCSLIDVNVFWKWDLTIKTPAYDLANVDPPLASLLFFPSFSLEYDSIVSNFDPHVSAFDAGQIRAYHQPVVTLKNFDLGNPVRYLCKRGHAAEV
jgi:hypothetical protein